ncbi:unnamed protein product [Closterium sp. NIES-65]|nr:unnamed protein product [Closterium sp. NIES-65]
MSVQLTHHIPCYDPNIAVPLSLRRQTFSASDTLPPPSARPRCLIPPPPGYQRAPPWPDSLWSVWRNNVPHSKMLKDPRNVLWMELRGNTWHFPARFDAMPEADGAERYVAQLRNFIPFGSRLRTALDIGAGVGGFAVELLRQGMITVSLGPRDGFRGQAQFALERGLPALVGILATMRLPFPSLAFDLVHCSHCQSPSASPVRAPPPRALSWPLAHPAHPIQCPRALAREKFVAHLNSRVPEFPSPHPPSLPTFPPSSPHSIPPPLSLQNGTHLFEGGRVLRAGGVFVLAGPPVRWPGRAAEWRTLRDKARALCWRLVLVVPHVAIWRKSREGVEVAGGSGEAGGKEDGGRGREKGGEGGERGGRGREGGRSGEREEGGAEREELGSDVTGEEEGEVKREEGEEKREEEGEEKREEEAGGGRGEMGAEVCAADDQPDAVWCVPLLPPPATACHAAALPPTRPLRSCTLHLHPRPAPTVLAPLPQRLLSAFSFSSALLPTHPLQVLPLAACAIRPPPSAWSLPPWPHRLLVRLPRIYDSPLMHPPTDPPPNAVEGGCWGKGGREGRTREGGPQMGEERRCKRARKRGERRGKSGLKEGGDKAVEQVRESNSTEAPVAAAAAAAAAAAGGVGGRRLLSSDVHGAGGAAHGEGGRGRGGEGGGEGGEEEREEGKGEEEERRRGRGGRREREVGSEADRTERAAAGQEGEEGGDMRKALKEEQQKSLTMQTQQRSQQYSKRQSTGRARSTVARRQNAHEHGEPGAAWAHDRLAHLRGAVPNHLRPGGRHPEDGEGAEGDGGEAKGEKSEEKGRSKEESRPGKVRNVLDMNAGVGSFARRRCRGGGGRGRGERVWVMNVVALSSRLNTLAAVFDRRCSWAPCMTGVRRSRRTHAHTTSCIGKASPPPSTRESRCPFCCRWRRGIVRWEEMEHEAHSVSHLSFHGKGFYFVILPNPLRATPQGPM